MVYKSKKINKRRYRRQSRKLIRKRMYGGDDKSNNVAVDNIMQKIEEENKITLPNIEEIPVVGPIIEKTGDLVEGAAVQILDKFGDSIGVDINNPESIGEKLDDIKDAVSSPENIEKTKEILANAGEYVGLVVDAAAPVIEKTSEKILPVVMKEADKATKAVAKTGLNLIQDVTGPIIGIPRTLLSAAEALKASVNAGSALVKAMAAIGEGTLENVDEEIKKDKPPNINEEMNKDIPPNINEEMNKDIPPNINEEMNKDIPPNIKYKQQGGGLLKKYKKEGLMIGGRISQSQSEFLRPHVNSSQNLQQSGGKWNTKRRHYLKHKMTSRSYK